MFTFPVGFLGASHQGPLTIASAAGCSRSSSFTADLGAARNDIFVAVVCLNKAYSNGTSPAAITVGGGALSKVAERSYAGNCGSIWFGKGPVAGGNQTVAVTGGSSLYTLYKPFVILGSSNASFDVGASSLGASVALGVAKGGVIAAIETMADTDLITWTGATDADNYLYNSWSTGWGAYTAANAEASHSIYVNRSDGLPLVAASFKP